jgi:hypothetical protein
MIYPRYRLTGNSVVRNFRITAIQALEMPENNTVPHGCKLTAIQKLTVQKQSEKGSSRILAGEKGGEMAKIGDGRIRSSPL